jgi:PAS domain S-box-containing protein
MAKVQVLIVNDKVDASRELETRLNALGYEVAGIAAAGEEALALAASAAPGIVLMHMKPGSRNAIALAEAIGRDHSIPVVFTGAAAGEEVVERAGLTEPCGYLVEPFSDRELRTTLELTVCRHDTALAAHELAGFFDVSLDMFCFLDTDGFFRRLNPAWERTLGFTREELMSRRFIEFVHPDDRERTLKQNAEVRGGGRAIGFENRYMCSDGTHRWFLWNATFHSAEGVIYSAARDITVRKQAEAERADLVRQLEASLAEVRSLREILPICMYCKNIRDDSDYWHTVEQYISTHTKTRFSHGICPSCMETEVEPLLAEPDAG